MWSKWLWQWYDYWCQTGRFEYVRNCCGGRYGSGGKSCHLADQRVAGLIPPWAWQSVPEQDTYTPNCSWWVGWCLAWQPIAIGVWIGVWVCVWMGEWEAINCTALWIKALYKCSPFTICWSLLIFTHNRLDFAENGAQQFCGQKLVVNERSQRRRARLIEADKVTITQITTHYNSGMQKSISEHTMRQTSKWYPQQTNKSKKEV